MVVVVLLGGLLNLWLSNIGAKFFVYVQRS